MFLAFPYELVLFLRLSYYSTATVVHVSLKFWSGWGEVFDEVITEIVPAHFVTEIVTTFAEIMKSNTCLVFVRHVLRHNTYMYSSPPLTDSIKL